MQGTPKAAITYTSNTGYSASSKGLSYLAICQQYFPLVDRDASRNNPTELLSVAADRHVPEEPTCLELNQDTGTHSRPTGGAEDLLGPRWLFRKCVSSDTQCCEYVHLY